MMTDSSENSERDDIVKLRINIKTLKTALRSSFNQREVQNKEF